MVRKPAVLPIYCAVFTIVLFVCYFFCLLFFFISYTVPLSCFLWCCKCLGSCRFPKFPIFIFGLKINAIMIFYFCFISLIWAIFDALTFRGLWEGKFMWVVYRNLPFLSSQKDKQGMKSSLWKLPRQLSTILFCRR